MLPSKGQVLRKRKEKKEERDEKGELLKMRGDRLAFVFAVDAFFFFPTLAAGAGQSRPGLRPF